MPTSKNYLTCAYATINFGLKKGENETYHSCVLISKSSFINKKLEYYLQNDFILYPTVVNSTIKNVEVEIVDKDNNKLTRDINNKIIVELSSNSEENTEEIIEGNDTPSNTSSSSSKGEYIRIYCLILIYLLISLL